MKIQASVVSMLKLQRSSTYKDTTTFLDELAQNAQRAGASRLDIQIDENSNKVVVMNNGSVLEDMQVLFSMGDSGWGDKTKSENPFGIGFFSNVSVSDDILVESGKGKVHFDVRKAIEDGILDLTQEESETVLEGFRVTLSNFDYDKCPYKNLREKAQLLGEYIQTLDVFVDGQEVIKKDLTKTDGSLYSCKIIQPGYANGWISIQPNFFSNLTIFYKGRVVTEMSDMWYVSGEIHIEDGVLNLTAPDRKDIIKDNKYEKFVGLIRETIREYASEIAVDSKNVDESYVDGISHWADLYSTYQKVKFSVFCGGETDHMKAINNLITRKTTKEVDRGFGTMASDAEAFLDVTEIVEENEVSATVEVTETTPKYGFVSGGGGGYTTGKSPSQTKQEIERESLEDTLQSLIGDELVFWIGHDELMKYESKLPLIKHYSLNVVVSSNKIQDSYLKIFGYRKSNVYHIEELKEIIHATATLSNTDLSPSEKRAAHLLSMISRIIGRKESLFRIGDLSLETEVEVACTDIRVSLQEQNVVSFADAKSKKVMLDRNLIHCSMLQKELTNDLNLEDYKFILANIHTILKQVYLLDKNLPETMGLSSDLLEKITHGLAFN